MHYKIKGQNEFKIKPMKYLKFGIYIASVTMFYGEEITYFFNEELNSGSITTQETIFINNVAQSSENPGKFEDINNCLMYIEKSRFDKVETVIAEYLKPHKTIIGKIL
jgi:hypothetical protein